MVCLEQPSITPLLRSTLGVVHCVVTATIVAPAIVSAVDSNVVTADAFQRTTAASCAAAVRASCASVQAGAGVVKVGLA